MRYFYLVVVAVLFLNFSGCVEKNSQIVKQTESYSYAMPTKKTEDTEEIKEVEPDLIDHSKEYQANMIAILYPSYDIGKYALEATNSINTYLLYKRIPFAVEVFDMFTQQEENIIKLFSEIEEKKIVKVIAMITLDHLPFLKNVPNIEKYTVYLPLVNRCEVDAVEQYDHMQLTFGGISYKKQFEKLFEYAQDQKFVELYDNTSIGHFLHRFLVDQPVVYTKEVDDNNGRYHLFIKQNDHIDQSAIVLNTQIIKSSILLSSLIGQEKDPSMILSTQINYTPLIFSLTQTPDREKLFIANSIGKIPLELIEYNEILGESISYSWVNYSVAIGAEFLTNGNIDFFDDLKIEEKQVIYPIDLYRAKGNSFQLISE